MILLHFLFSLIPLLLLLFTLNQNANGLYVPRVYGHVDPQKCLFITETGEKHQIYKYGEVYMFGRVYLLDEENKNKLIENRNGNGNGKCKEMEKLKRLANSDSSTNHIVFKHTRRSTVSTTILKADQYGNCLMKSAAEGLEFPIHSCQTMSSALRTPNPCPAEHYFYLEESMNSSDTMPKLVVFSVKKDQIRFCAQIFKPTGLSEFVKKSWSQRLGAKFSRKGNNNATEEEEAEEMNEQQVQSEEAEEEEMTNSELQTAAAEVEQQQTDEAADGSEEKKKKKNIRWNKLIYRGLSLFVGRLKCNNIKFHSNNSVSSELKNTGYQIKMICEDMKGILVQVVKGNLENGKLLFLDLQSKLDKTIYTLREKYIQTFAQEGAPLALPVMPKPSIFVVLKNVKQLFKTMKLELSQSTEPSDSAMKERLKTFAGTLLYFLDKIQYFYRKPDWNWNLNWNWWRSSHNIGLLCCSLLMIVTVVGTLAFFFFLVSNPAGWIMTALFAVLLLSAIVVPPVKRAIKAKMEGIQQARFADRHLGGSQPNLTPPLWKRFWHRISGGAGNSAVMLREGEEIYRRRSDDKAVNPEEASSSTGPRNEENARDECPVCLEEFTDGAVIKKMPACNHIFHTGCIDGWTQEHSTCPICRQEIPGLPNPAAPHH